MGKPRRLVPIYTSLPDSSAVLERIDEFVYGISERMDHIQEAEIAKDLPLCAKLLVELGRDGENLGFEILHEAALAAAERCEKNDDYNLLEQLQEVMEIVQRIKRGHRSTA